MAFSLFDHASVKNFLIHVPVHLSTYEPTYAYTYLNTTPIQPVHTWNESTKVWTITEERMSKRYLLVLVFCVEKVLHFLELRGHFLQPPSIHLFGKKRLRDLFLKHANTMERESEKIARARGAGMDGRNGQQRANTGNERRPKRMESSIDIPLRRSPWGHRPECQEPFENKRKHPTGFSGSPDCTRRNKS